MLFEQLEYERNIKLNQKKKEEEDGFNQKKSILII